MNIPNPALISQDAVGRLPAWAKYLLCGAYILAGFVGRDPWKNSDLASYGIMRQLQASHQFSDWLAPGILNLHASASELLPYWIGAWTLRLLPSGWPAEFFVRLPFMLMLAATLAATWLAVYHLALQDSAQPVAMAFGQSVQPRPYAHALADGGLLALIACLGLAQMSHETTPGLTRLFFASIIFLGLSAASLHPRKSALALLLGFAGLSLSGAPILAFFLAAIFSLASMTGKQASTSILTQRYIRISLLLSALICALAAWLSGALLQLSPDWASYGRHWHSLPRLYLWFTWPAWPLAIWALWQWRRQLLEIQRHRHLALPVSMLVIILIATLLTPDADRTLLLTLPALAALAAFALPTFKRSGAALIDWFTVLFFSAWAIVIWVVWISMQTGIPAKPAANVARLAPGFEPRFQSLAFIAAILTSVAWIALVRWRTGRYRAVLWKSMVLPASGTALCWILLMSLWLPALNYGRSYAVQMQQIQAFIGTTSCVEVEDVGMAQAAALDIYTSWKLVSPQEDIDCPWRLQAGNLKFSPASSTSWKWLKSIHRPTDRSDTINIFQRIEP